MIDKDIHPIACMQGGSLRPVNNYQSNIMMEPRSPHAAWQIGPTKIAKHQEDKNDSGLASGSDFHSSSPGSDTSQHSPQAQNPQLNRYYSTSMLPMFVPNAYHHHPLTPPNSEPLVSPKSEKEEKEMDATLTPCASPSQAKTEESNHLRSLEMTMEKNLALSSKNSENSMDDASMKSDNDVDDFDEHLRTPKVNNGKVKTFKCKQCDFVSTTKVDQWNHIRTHIREDKILSCPKCPFITEYKHHLEYHLRNHAGSKPFSCPRCEYSCVNKSMLNSHMKSHSSVYRFSCRDCSYATKYCHSLKLHLRRYNHTPNVVLDEHGNPCPDQIIDVYGTRRGPKVKTQTMQVEEQPREQPRPEVAPFNVNLTPQLPFSPYSLFAGFPNAQLLQHLIRERQNFAASISSTPTHPPASPEPEPEAEADTKVLDLSKPGGSDVAEQQKSRRKGVAFKLDPEVVDESDEEDDDDEMTTTMFSNVETVVDKNEEKEEVTLSEESVEDGNNNNKEDKSCQYCNITFGDDVLYSIHMGYHGFRDPFTCNMCGKECSDKLAFNLHMVRASHS